VALAGVGLASGVLLLVGCGSAGSPGAAGSASPSASAAAHVQTITVSVTDGKITPPPKRYQVKLGTTLRIVVHDNQPEEVHVHGYNLKAEIVDGVATVQFVANQSGVFDFELEHEGKSLGSLEIQ
jgi:hypothetical protein